MRGFSEDQNPRTISTTLTIEQYAFLLESAPVMIWRADAAGRYDYFSESWLRFRGRTMEQEGGEGWVEGVHPDDAATCMDNRRVCFRVRAPFRMSYRLRRQDGAWRWVCDSGTPIYGEDGSFGGFVGSCVELVERREWRWKELSGVLSLCSWCHRVQEDDGSWEEIDRYVARHASISFTHGICPGCLLTASFRSP